jgi:hypothetical protein
MKANYHVNRILDFKLGEGCNECDQTENIEIGQSRYWTCEIEPSFIFDLRPVFCMGESYVGSIDRVMLVAYLEEYSSQVHADHDIQLIIHIYKQRNLGSFSSY